MFFRKLRKSSTYDFGALVVEFDKDVVHHEEPNRFSP